MLRWGGPSGRAAGRACPGFRMIRRLCYKNLGKTTGFAVNFFQHSRLKKEGTMSREFIKIPDECPRFHGEDSGFPLVFVNSCSFRKMPRTPSPHPSAPAPTGYRPPPPSSQFPSKNERRFLPLHLYTSGQNVYTVSKE